MSECGSANQLILFDCDGTLTDSQGAIVQAMQNAFVSCGLGVPADEKIRGIIGLSLPEAVKGISPDVSLNKRIASSYRDHYVASELSISLYPGVVDTLAELKDRGYQLGVVTGKSKAGLLRVLEQFGLIKYFSVFRTADCCPSKPQPDMALECMAEAGFTPEETSLVGDALFDMQMAIAARIRAYGVSFGVESADALYQAGAYNVVDEFPALLEHFPPLNRETFQTTISATGVL